MPYSASRPFSSSLLICLDNLLPLVQHCIMVTFDKAVIWINHLINQNMVRLWIGWFINVQILITIKYFNLMEVELKVYKTINYISKGMCLKGHHVLHNVGSNYAILNFQNACNCQNSQWICASIIENNSHLHKIMVKYKISCKLMVIPT